MTDKNNQGCTGCKKGLAFVAERIISGKDSELKKMRLCSRCRSILTTTATEAFKSHFIQITPVWPLTGLSGAGNGIVKGE